MVSDHGRSLVSPRRCAAHGAAHGAFCVTTTPPAVGVQRQDYGRGPEMPYKVGAVRFNGWTYAPLPNANRYVVNGKAQWRMEALSSASRVPAPPNQVPGPVGRPITRYQHIYCTKQGCSAALLHSATVALLVPPSFTRARRLFAALLALAWSSSLAASSIRPPVQDSSRAPSRLLLPQL